jgi:cell division protein FtsB
MSESPELIQKLKESSLEVQEYVSALKAENSKLHRKIAQLEAQNISLENRIEALKTSNNQMTVEEAVQSYNQLKKQLIKSLRDEGYVVTEPSQFS